MTQTNNEKTIIEELAEYSLDPLAFVYYAFPWGKKGTVLEKQDSPIAWQIDVLNSIKDKLIAGYEVTDTVAQTIQQIDDMPPILEATTSGHGIGKSALVAWIILWAISTYEDTKGVVTANTENQLKTKTWAELAKWYAMFVGKDYFKWTATALFARDPDHAATWRIDMIPWSEKNTEAFAGLHNQGKRILVIYDEASAIPDIIWEVTEGALTDKSTQIIWAVFGNPTKQTGRFRDCFEGGKFAHRWNSRKVDSREVPFTNKKQIANWIEDFGADSDFCRVRIYGEFPRADLNSFISYAVALEATTREVYHNSNLPLFMGVDVARFGDDFSCFVFRRGRDARTIPFRTYQKIDLVKLSQEVMKAYAEHRVDYIMVDGTGLGGGVVDILHNARLPVFEINFSSKAEINSLANNVKYKNKRSEMWGAMKDWLATGAIPATTNSNGEPIEKELSKILYYVDDHDKIVLESKKNLKARGEKSPDFGDALALTLAMPSLEFSLELDIYSSLPKANNIIADYNPLDIISLDKGY